MLQKVLIPLDGSALAETVIPQAQALARPTDSIVLLLHVVTPSETSQTRWLPGHNCWLLGLFSRARRP